METVVTFLLIIGAIFLVSFLAGRNNEKTMREKCFRAWDKSFGKVPAKKMSPQRFEHIGGYEKRHRGTFTIDDITWNDLDMDQVYRRIDATESASGEEYLCFLLRTPAQKTEETAVDEALIHHFEEEDGAADRKAILWILRSLGHTGAYSLYDYLDRLDELGERSNTREILQLILPFAMIGVMFWNTRVGLILLLISLAANVITYFQGKSRISPYLACFRYLLRLLKCADRLSVVLQKSDPALYRKEIEALNRGREALSSFRRGSSMLMAGSASSGNPVDVVLDYVRIFFHIDLIKFNAMLSDVKTHLADIDELTGVMGRLDAQISIASFRKSLPSVCVPDLVETTGKEAPVFEVKGLVHPLLAKPVANDLTAKRGVLLTGSNASGKSTFLKSIMLCALLSQSIHTAPATSYRGSYFRLLTSMALRDSIREGQSYFMVEIRSLKRILDASEETASCPVLAAIDEVLRGTNTIERIAASGEILPALEKGNALIFAATHDIELSELLGGSFTNMHFTEEIKDGDVVFSYRLMDGPATTRNAIRLLSMVGFDSALTRNAEERAEHFEQTGEWKL